MEETLLATRQIKNKTKLEKPKQTRKQKKKVLTVAVNRKAEKETANESSKVKLLRKTPLLTIELQMFADDEWIFDEECEAVR
mmetsp:Transcript_11686/g.28005  ORF Transcript_11686/g.28005 Transcript_11686/m.28005 type:complete len:82 (+) Transcript_11686:2710-2955(+)